MEILLMAGAGLAAGGIGGLLGVGGGVILVPVFVYLFKMNMHQAIGTSLAIIVPTALLGALRHQMDGAVLWRFVLITGLAAMAAAFWAANVSLSMDVRILKKSFAVLMMFISLYMFFKP